VPQRENEHWCFLKIRFLENNLPIIEFPYLHPFPNPFLPVNLPVGRVLRNIKNYFFQGNYVFYGKMTVLQNALLDKS
jgi:hypothetical protein